MRTTQGASSLFAAVRQRLMSGPRTTKAAEDSRLGSDTRPTTRRYSDHGKPITFDQIGCARCGGDGHDGMTFAPFTFPVELDDGTALTHWAPCPTNGEPILLMILQKDAP